MKCLKQYTRLFFLIFFIGAFSCACSKSSYINVTYSLPYGTDVLKGRSVFLKVQDTRPDDVIFGEKAQKEFKYFTGIFSFSLAEEKKESIIVGPFYLKSLFGEAFKRRLENMGVTVIPEQRESEPEIEIVMKIFLIDIKGKNWVVDISYEARLIKDKKLLATQNITGRAERLKLIGHGSLEKVLGEGFTDVVNKFDLNKLYRQANL